MALEYMHERHIAHRDIKLENIIIDHREHIKLIDFGISHDIGKTDVNYGGTPGYMAAPRCNGYTLGCPGVPRMPPSGAPGCPGGPC